MQYDRATALVVVDVQNDFADPAGALYVRGGEDVVPVANREILRATDAGSVVVYTQDWHPPSTPHFAKDGGIWPVHCVQGSWGAELHPALLRVDAIAVRSGADGSDGYSAFTERHPLTGEETDTGLASRLRALGVERVVVLGLATDYCVRATALDAVRAGFATTVLRDGVRAVEREPGDGERALEEMRQAGVDVP
ncbi:MAG: isochorismatase family protein [Thermodesulfobacteriota bacterium]